MTTIIAFSVNIIIVFGRVRLSIVDLIVVVGE